MRVIFKPRQTRSNTPRSDLVVQVAQIELSVITNAINAGSRGRKRQANANVLLQFAWRQAGQAYWCCGYASQFWIPLRMGHITAANNVAIKKEIVYATLAEGD